MLSWKCCDRVLVLDRPIIMGILNVTPDSFSDGGQHYDRDKAVARGLQMVEDGATIIDVGGESARPGALEVSEKEELVRTISVIRELSAKTNAVISIDTMKAEVARQALEAGACIINDISALTHDPQMIEVAVESGAGVVLMHMRGTPRTMQDNPVYDDVLVEVRDYLVSRVEELLKKGLKKESLAIDPGIGFGKTPEHNIQLLAGLGEQVSLGLPVVVGLSRKRFLGMLTGCEVDKRLSSGLAALTFCVLHGAHVLRVHDVKESHEAIQVACALKGM